MPNLTCPVDSYAMIKLFKTVVHYTIYQRLFVLLCSSLSVIYCVDGKPYSKVKGCCSLEPLLHNDKQNRW